MEPLPSLIFSVAIYLQKLKMNFSMMIIAVEMWILFRDEIWKSELSNLMNSRM